MHVTHMSAASAILSTRLAHSVDRSVCFVLFINLLFNAICLRLPKRQQQQLHTRQLMTGHRLAITPLPPAISRLAPCVAALLALQLECVRRCLCM